MTTAGIQSEAHLTDSGSEIFRFFAGLDPASSFGLAAGWPTAMAPASDSTFESAPLNAVSSWAHFLRSAYFATRPIKSSLLPLRGVDQKILHVST